jgi:hypothetical protein
MQPGASAGVISSGVAGVFPGGGMGGGLWGAGGASLAGASQANSQVLLFTLSFLYLHILTAPAHPPTPSWRSRTRIKQILFVSVDASRIHWQHDRIFCLPAEADHEARSTPGRPVSAGIAAAQPHGVRSGKLRSPECRSPLGPVRRLRPLAAARETPPRGGSPPRRRSPPGPRLTPASGRRIRPSAAAPWTGCPSRPTSGAAPSPHPHRTRAASGPD